MDITNTTEGAALLRGAIVQDVVDVDGWDTRIIVSCPDGKLRTIQFRTPGTGGDLLLVDPDGPDAYVYTLGTPG
jgi:hypothetical protein